MSDDVRREVVAVGVGHDFAIHRAGLTEIVVLGVLLIRVASKLAGFHRPAEIRAALWVGLGAAVAIGRIDGLGAGVVVGHRRILVVGMHVDPGGVDRELLVVGADPVQMGVVVGEDPSDRKST